MELDRRGAGMLFQVLIRAVMVGPFELTSQTADQWPVPLSTSVPRRAASCAVRFQHRPREEAVTSLATTVESAGEVRLLLHALHSYASDSGNSADDPSGPAGASRSRLRVLDSESAR
jgi:hypothetical protein